jgi:hypothetical protein
VTADYNEAFGADALVHHDHLPGFNVGVAEVALAARTLAGEFIPALVEAADVLAVEGEDGLLVREVPFKVLALGDAVLAVADLLAEIADDAMLPAEVPAAVNADGRRGSAALEEAALDVALAVSDRCHFSYAATLALQFQVSRGDAGFTFPAISASDSAGTAEIRK